MEALLLLLLLYTHGRELSVWILTGRHPAEVIKHILSHLLLLLLLLLLLWADKHPGDELWGARAAICASFNVDRFLLGCNALLGVQTHALLEIRQVHEVLAHGPCVLGVLLLGWLLRLLGLLRSLWL